MVSTPAVTAPATGRERSLFAFLGTGQVRRAALSGYLGSTIEFYDFILYATASSVVFGPLFFSGLNPLMQTVASYGTFATGYLSRPIGGIVFGHFGDRVGRKRMLLISMSVMGVASTLVGLVPSVPTLGAVCLILLRLIQGIAIGGEWGGSALLALEHSGGRKRGLAASFANAGGPSGAFLGTAALALFALLPHEQFVAWGWRVPFLLSAVLLIIGLYVRMTVQESPMFEKAVELDKSERAKRSIPLLEVLKRPRALIVGAFSGMGSFVIQGLFSTLALTYAVQHGVSQSVGLWGFAASQAAAAITIPIWASLSDRLGRRPVMIFGLLALAAVAFPLWSMFGSGSNGQVIAAFLIALPLLQSATFGPLAAFVSETFATSSRYTGASLGYQFASLLGAGFTPVIAASLLAAGHGNPAGVLWYLIGMCVVSALVLLLFARESKDLDITD
ncbi:MFS transporter [Gryllotalpicola daejeonensis]|uniref:MFS transporter n=1 Tax=Gryllotalpicola daejeonensis TaxID=993087 RepID=A0ABP7ZKT2_9MICO